jgi:hypothetical protein
MMAGTKSQKEKKWLPTAPEGKKDSAGIKVVTPMSSPKRKSKADIVTESQEKAKKKKEDGT